MTTTITDVATQHALDAFNRIYMVERPHHVTIGDIMRQAIAEAVPGIRDAVIEDLVASARNGGRQNYGLYAVSYDDPADNNDEGTEYTLTQWLRAHLSHSPPVDASAG